MQRSKSKTEAFSATRYVSLTDEQLYCLFTEEQWTQMDVQRRLDALQEIEIRMAVKQKRKPCKVSCEMMRPGSQGYFDGNQIVINELLLQSKTLFGGSLGARGITALDTVIHEGRHAFQTGVVTGMIDSNISAEQRRIWAINSLAYIGGGLAGEVKNGFYMYAFQPLDRDAREYAGREIAEIYKQVIRATGKRDPMFESGIADIRKEKRVEFEGAAKMKKEELELMRVIMAELFGRAHLTQLSVEYMGEAISINMFMAINGIDNSTLKDLLDAQTKDLRDIVDGKKGLDDYMDGLDDKSLSEMLDTKMDSGRKKTLTELAGQIFKPKSDLSGIEDGSKVKVDGKKKSF